MGIKEINVIRKPRVYVIITGNELVEPGEKLEEGKIYDTNSFSGKNIFLKPESALIAG